MKKPKRVIKKKEMVLVQQQEEEQNVQDHIMKEEAARQSQPKIDPQPDVEKDPDNEMIWSSEKKQRAKLFRYLNQLSDNSQEEKQKEKEKDKQVQVKIEQTEQDLKYLKAIQDLLNEQDNSNSQISNQQPYSGMVFTKGLTKNNGKFGSIIITKFQWTRRETLTYSSQHRTVIKIPECPICNKVFYGCREMGGHLRICKK